MISWLISNLGQAFTTVQGYSFLAFNLLCAPCFAAIGAIKREMNSARWTWFAVGYQCAFAYAVALMVNQFGRLFTGAATGPLDIVFLLAAAAVLVGMIYMLVRPGQGTARSQGKRLALRS